MLLIGDEIGLYPIDFKKRFGIDYSKYSLRPVRVREVNRLIWHTQLSSHNGGDFFNEVLDNHPNLLVLPSIMMDDLERQMKQLEEAMDRAKSLKEAREIFFGWTPETVEHYLQADYGPEGEHGFGRGASGGFAPDALPSGL